MLWEPDAIPYDWQRPLPSAAMAKSTYSQAFLWAGRTCFAYLVFVALFSFFAYWSDYVPLSTKHFRKDHPQFEAEFLTIFLIIITPGVALLSAIAYYLCELLIWLRWLPRFKPCRDGRLVAIFAIAASLILPPIFGYYLRATSCCPMWQCRILEYGFGAAFFCSIGAYTFGFLFARDDDEQNG